MDCTSDASPPVFASFWVEFLLSPPLEELVENIQICIVYCLNRVSVNPDVHIVATNACTIGGAASVVLVLTLVSIQPPPEFNRARSKSVDWNGQ